MKNLFLPLLALLVLFGACQKSALVDNSASSAKVDYTLKALLTTYPANLISSPIVTNPADFTEQIIHEQTPINIVTTSTVKFNNSNPVLHYNLITLSSVLNNAGENLKVNVTGADKANNYVTFNGKKYNLAQFHFHYSSEHTVNGNYSPMEVHFVNIAADNSYAVLGVLLNLGNSNKSLTTLFRYSPKVADEVKSYNTTIDLTKILPSNIKNYYTYRGSLTTPHYGESSNEPNGGPVTWVVFKNGQTIDNKSISDYTGIYVESNFRTIQPLGSRKVYENIQN